MVNFKTKYTGTNSGPTKKHKCKARLNVVKRIFFEYSNESSIHGVKYIGDRKRPALDRIIWLCAVICSFLTCCYLISNIWEKRTETPVIVTFKEKLMPVWEIPFPSVTICTETKSHTKIFNFTEIYWKIADYENISEDKEYLWEAVSQTCRPRLPARSYGQAHANASDLIKAMLHAAPAFDETFCECSWKRTVVECKEIFDYVLTEEGICFTFNSLRSAHYRAELNNLRRKDFIGYKFDNDRHSEWDLENGYNNQADVETFPKRVLGSGELESLILFLTDSRENEELMCRNGVHGFKITLHTPGEEPQVSKKFINIPHDQTVVVTIKPKIVTTSEGLRRYHPDRRQCYFQNERYLRYFTVYTQANCELECLTNQTLEKCGCVKFSMPRNLSHPVCGAASVKCLDDVKNYSNLIKFKLEKNPNKFDNFNNVCHCLPTCNEVEYIAELEHQVDINVIETAHAFREEDVDELITNRVTQIHIHFKEDVFNSLKRSELYSMTDFIANCGGLLGLCMGISVISLVELVYFFIIKLCTNLKTRKANHGEELKNKRNLRKFVDNKNTESDSIKIYYIK